LKKSQEKLILKEKIKEEKNNKESVDSKNL